jgi:magnesium-transporting ATPase (P-type)
MQNKLKPVTIGVIDTLNRANIRTIMATGDNVLTAISVGRECNLIEPDHEVFLGDLVYKKTGKNVVQWRSTRGEQSGKKLNVGTLLIDDGRESNQVTPLKRKSFEVSSSYEQEGELERSINDVIALYDFPWQHPPEEYSIAITGRAFNHLLNDPS